MKSRTPLQYTQQNAQEPTDPDNKPVEFLPDILRLHLDVIIVGAAASHHSARLRHWYAGPTNKFYPLLHQAGFTPRRLRPEEDITLPDYGIGLTCLHKFVASGANHLLPEPTDAMRSEMRAKLLRYTPRFVCYNGKDVYEMCAGNVCLHWGEQEERLGDSRVFVVHSSSARADAWGQERLALYRELRSLITSSRK